MSDLQMLAEAFDFGLRVAAGRVDYLTARDTLGRHILAIDNPFRGPNAKIAATNLRARSEAAAVGGR